MVWMETLLPILKKSAQKGGEPSDFVFILVHVGHGAF